MKANISIARTISDLNESRNFMSALKCKIDRVGRTRLQLIADENPYFVLTTHDGDGNKALLKDLIERNLDIWELIGATEIIQRDGCSQSLVTQSAFFIYQADHSQPLRLFVDNCMDIVNEHQIESFLFGMWETSGGDQIFCGHYLKTGNDPLVKLGDHSSVEIFASYFRAAVPIPFQTPPEWVFLGTSGPRPTDPEDIETMNKHRIRYVSDTSNDDEVRVRVESKLQKLRDIFREQRKKKERNGS